MVVGVGVDMVDITRFEKQLAKAPGLLERLFTAAERDGSMQSVAGRFAAKEALIKALSGSDGLSWQEVEITKNSAGKPEILTTGATAKALVDAGVSKLHLSISHDGGMAIAMVVAE